MNFCFECNYFDFEYGCLNDGDMINCPLYLYNNPDTLQEYENNIRSFEKSISNKKE